MSGLSLEVLPYIPPGVSDHIVDYISPTDWGDLSELLGDCPQRQRIERLAARYLQDRCPVIDAFSRKGAQSAYALDPLGLAEAMRVREAGVFHQLGGQRLLDEGVPVRSALNALSDLADRGEARACMWVEIIHPKGSSEPSGIRLAFFRGPHAHHRWPHEHYEFVCLFYSFFFGKRVGDSLSKLEEVVEGIGCSGVIKQPFGPAQIMDRLGDQQLLNAVRDFGAPHGAPNYYSDDPAELAHKVMCAANEGKSIERVEAEATEWSSSCCGCHCPVTLNKARVCCWEPFVAHLLAWLSRMYEGLLKFWRDMCDGFKWFAKWLEDVCT